MDPFSSFLTALLAWLNDDDNMTALGITGAKPVQKGAHTSINTPGCLVWLDAIDGTQAGDGSGLSVTCDVAILVVAKPKANYHDAWMEGFGIAHKLMQQLGGATIDNSVMDMHVNTPVEVVNATSNSFIVAVNFTVEIAV